MIDIWKVPVLTLVFFIVVGCMSFITTEVKPTPPPPRNLPEAYHPVHYVATTVGDAGSGCDL